MCTLSIHDLNLCQQYPEFRCDQCCNDATLHEESQGKVLENSSDLSLSSTRYQPDITP